MIGTQTRAACAVLLSVFALTSQNVSAITLPSGFTEFPVVSGLSNPTAMAFAPDGRLFVCEQGGRLRVIRDGALLPTPFLTVTVDSSGERGLLGVAFPANFPTDPSVFVYYTATTPTLHQRLSRFTANGDVAVPGSEVFVLDLAPDPSSASNHNGGALKFLPDGTLLVAVGERAQASNSQLMTNLFGKMLRINPDGSIPTNNPFFGSATGNNRLIWALGLRNPFTFDVQPGTGRVFINDVGGGSWEEINDGIAGSNYGWPTTEGATTDPRFRAPLHAYSHSFGCAIVGGAFYNPATFNFPPEYTGRYFFADLCQNVIRVFNPANGTAADFGTQTVGTPVDLEVGPNGNLYYLARSGGTVRRIAHTAGTAPVVTTPPASQTVALDDPVTFSVTASGTAPLSYQWQRNGTDIGGATASTYSIAMATMMDNTARFRVRVTNTFGSVTSAEAILTVTNNRRPSAAIDTPVVGTMYSGGQTISFSGTGNDSEDGPLAGSAFTWTVVFHHDTHTHPHLPATGGSTTGSFGVPTVGETATNVWFRIHLTVTDSGGLTRTVFRDVSPRLARITLATNPTGLTVNVDGGGAQTAPHAFDAVVGMIRSIGTTLNQNSGGTTWQFQSWSDGGALTHDITVPATATTYTATFRNLGRPVAPTLIGPSGQTGVTRPTYQWNAVAEAAEYQLWVNNPAGTAIIQAWHAAATVCSGATCSVTPAVTLGTGQHTWWIQARNAAGASPWSSAMMFTVGAPAAPTLVSPNGSGVATRPTYSWNTVASATDYQIWVNGPAGTPVVQQWLGGLTDCAGATCTATPAVDLGPGAHQFWIQARNSFGAGPWSAAMSFTVSSGGTATPTPTPTVPGATPTPTPTPTAPPSGRPGAATLVAPTGTVTNARPAYTWNAATGAADYLLWVDGPSGMTVIQTWHAASAVCSGATCTVTPTTSLMNGGHTWWIQTRNAAGAGPWSAGMMFTVSASATPTPATPPAPVLVGPTGTVTTATPTYTWNPAAGAAGYFLWVSNAAGTAVVQIRYDSSVCATTCSVTPSVSLMSGAHTFWVQASNASGNGPWSSGMSFTR
jgi:glucose/arabinose dehydrogenase